MKSRGTEYCKMNIKCIIIWSVTYVPIIEFEFEKALSFCNKISEGAELRLAPITELYE